MVLTSVLMCALSAWIGGRQAWQECDTQLAFAEKKTMEVGVRLQDKKGSGPKQEVQSSFPKEKIGKE